MHPDAFPTPPERDDDGLILPAARLPEVADEFVDSWSLSGAQNITSTFDRITAQPPRFEPAMTSRGSDRVTYSSLDYGFSYRYDTPTPRPPHPALKRPEGSTLGGTTIPRVGDEVRCINFYGWDEVSEGIVTSIGTDDDVNIERKNIGGIWRVPLGGVRVIKAKDVGLAKKIFSPSKEVERFTKNL